MYNKKAYTKWYKANRDKKVAYVKKAFLDLRLRALELLGNKCCKCGYNTDLRILLIDHVYDNGAAERKLLGVTWKYRRTILNQILAGSREYQALCPNCSYIKEYNRKMRN